MGDYTDLAWTVSTSNNAWETGILNGAVKEANRLDFLVISPKTGRECDGIANRADSRENPIERYQPIIRRNSDNR